MGCADDGGHAGRGAQLICESQARCAKPQELRGDSFVRSYVRECLRDYSSCLDECERISWGYCADPAVDQEWTVSCEEYCDD
jgi:hypothetical protein